MGGRPGDPLPREQPAGVEQEPRHQREQRDEAEDPVAGGPARQEDDERDDVEHPGLPERIDLVVADLQLVARVVRQREAGLGRDGRGPVREGRGERGLVPLQRGSPDGVPLVQHLRDERRALHRLHLGGAHPGRVLVADARHQVRRLLLRGAVQGHHLGVGLERGLLQVVEVLAAALAELLRVAQEVAVPQELLERVVLPPLLQGEAVLELQVVHPDHRLGPPGLAVLGHGQRHHRGAPAVPGLLAGNLAQQLPRVGVERLDAAAVLHGHRLHPVEDRGSRRLGRRRSGGQGEHARRHRQRRSDPSHVRLLALGFGSGRCDRPAA
jgi:hypothetical protein